MYDDDDDGFIT